MAAQTPICDADHQEVKFAEQDIAQLQKSSEEL